MIISVTNQKGGAGKTTVACHLAFAAAEAGKPVLVIDLDTQGNASTTLTQQHDLPFKPGGSEVLFVPGADIVPMETGHPRISLLHGHQRLDALDNTRIADALKLRPVLAELAIRYPTIIIDTPPSLGVRHLAPLLWSNRVVIPMEPTSYSVHALGQVLATLTQVRQTNPGLAIKVVINRYLRNTRSHSSHIAALSSRAPLLEPYLGLRVAVQQSLEEGHPVWDHRGAEPELRAQWRELMEKLLNG